MKLKELEANYLKDLYLKHRGNIMQMVFESGISRATLYRKMAKHFGNFRYQLKEVK